MQSIERVTIKGRQYAIKTLPAGTALRIAGKLTKALGAGLGPLAAPGSKLDAAALTGLLDGFQEGDADAISRAFADVTMVENEVGNGKLVPLSAIFDVFYAGALDEWLEWFAWCLEKNFRPLVNGALAKFAARVPANGAAAAKLSASESTSPTE